MTGGWGKFLLRKLIAILNSLLYDTLIIKEPPRADLESRLKDRSQRFNNEPYGFDSTPDN
jgi:hypothetical protein